MGILRSVQGASFDGIFALMAVPNVAHLCAIGDVSYGSDTPPGASDFNHRSLEPWLSALLQAEHLSLLAGNGLTAAGVSLCGGNPPSMSAQVVLSDDALTQRFDAAVHESAVRTGRGSPNVEDYLRTAITLEAGLRIAGDDRADMCAAAIRTQTAELVESILGAERVIAEHGSEPVSGGADLTPVGYLVSLLMTFASRTPNRDRLHVFTTNYDRIIEHSCETAGVRIIDRFIGSLRPRFRASRMDVDMHYNPAGVLGEPRFLEGVVRLTKLHGSVDWTMDNDTICRSPLPFGSEDSDEVDNVLIYPTAAKDQETSFYPYAELFRDLSAALCRPNSVLVTYGYGFGDDHVNRIIADMLTIPSTHLLAISYDGASGRIARFVDSHEPGTQISLMVGPHFGDLRTLVDSYLPKPAIDDISWRRAALLRRRAVPTGDGEPDPPNAGTMDDDDLF
jgi:SIR2-like domain